MYSPSIFIKPVFLFRLLIQVLMEEVVHFASSGLNGTSGRVHRTLGRRSFCSRLQRRTQGERLGPATAEVQQ